MKDNIDNLLLDSNAVAWVVHNKGQEYLHKLPEFPMFCDESIGILKNCAKHIYKLSIVY